ncbi:MAG TPA: hypothetical protein VG347_25315 [Verrucomicrobiae bacterium]|nr:hypothetical protein [Verrucomicrobiae bacterium]
MMVAVAGLLLGGCASEPKPAAVESVSSSSKDIAIRNNAVSLLYDLLNDEQNVSKVLIIKRNSAELGRLIKDISKTAAGEKKQLEDMARIDPDLLLHAIELPPGEKATRDSIAKTKEHELLFTSGSQFEFNLLLTQTDALSYGWHLAKIAADNSSRPEEIEQFKMMSQNLKTLDDKVLTRLHSNK